MSSDVRKSKEEKTKTIAEDEMLIDKDRLAKRYTQHNTDKMWLREHHLEISSSILSTTNISTNLLSTSDSLRDPFLTSETTPTLPQERLMGTKVTQFKEILISVKDQDK